MTEGLILPIIRNAKLLKTRPLLNVDNKTMPETLYIICSIGKNILKTDGLLDDPDFPALKGHKPPAIIYMFPQFVLALDISHHRTAKTTGNHFYLYFTPR